MSKFNFGFNFGFDTTNETDSEIIRHQGDTMALSVLSTVICIFGFMGNGIFLWLLTFTIKRNSLTIYLLNFTISSLGLLIHLFHEYVYAIVTIVNKDIVIYSSTAMIQNLFLLMRSIGRLNLTAIGIDRCVSVLFPNWYRSHKSPDFSTVACSLIWVLFFILLINEAYFTLMLFKYWLLGTVLIFCLVVIASTLTLFIKACFKSQPQQCGTLTTVVLLTLPLFLLLDVLFIFCSSNWIYVLLGDCLVISMNPLIYFLVGRWKESQLQETMRAILQGVFKEEESVPITPTQLQSLP